MKGNLIQFSAKQAAAIMLAISLGIAPFQVAIAQNNVVVVPMFGEDPPQWKGPWLVDTNYKKTDVVEEGGSSYIALSNHTSDLSNIPPDTEFWGLVAAAGATGMQGPQGEQGLVGMTGAPGMDGEDGMDGAEGPQGAKGDKGDAGDDAPLPPVCVGSGKILQFDGATFSCVSLEETQLSNGMANGFELVDDWGDAWDGLSRAAKTWDQASAMCEAAGGRLPSVTELHRVNNSTGTGGIAGTAQVSYHWSLIPRGDPNVYYVLRFSDGNKSALTNTNTAVYRCVWPSNTIPTFAGNRCYGPPGDECFATSAEGGHYNVDKYDRPSITATAATRECALYGAHLPTQNALTETIQTGLPNGTDNSIWTSDHQGYNGTNFLLGVVKWQDTELTFRDVYPDNSTWSYNTNTTQQGFRCAGLKAIFMPYDGTVAAGYADPILLTTSTTSDSATAISYLGAIDACRANGGHLPYQRDLHELIVAGLPDGSNEYLWTADTQMGNASPAQTGVVRWTGTDTAYTDQYSTYATWANRNSSSEYYRCVYYPTDTNYTGPIDADCALGLGCYSNTVSNTGIDTTMWMDKGDRTAESYDNAVRNCYAAGGHLPTHRDYAEMLRSGLPNGSDTYVWTSDHVRYDQTRLVKWNGTNVAWADVNGVDSSTGNRATDNRPYRCVWSNELSW